MQENQTHIGNIPKPKRSNYVVFKCKDLQKSFNHKVLFKNVEFEILRSQKIVLLGRNGIGKSTLLKIMTGELRPDHGKHEYGDKVEFAYLSQDLSKLDSDNTIFEELNYLMPMKYDFEVRAYAGRFGFVGDETDKKIEVLSGGEKLKLSLAKILLKKPNFLILDEPTNHLDIMSIERLQEILDEYEGAIIMVTHDRRLLNYVSDRILVLEKNGIIEVKSINEYMTIMSEYTGFSSKDSKKDKKLLTYEKQKAFKNKIQKIERTINDINEEYDTLELEQQQLEKEMLLPANVKDYKKLKQLTDQNSKIEEKMLLLIKKLEVLENEKIMMLQGGKDAKY
jgi:ATP-binding cassette subfamily F protein 3